MIDELFVAVPHRVIDSLQAKGIAIYCYIGRYGPTCYVGLSKMSKNLGMRRETLQKYLNALITMGFIKRKFRPGRTHEYTIVIKCTPPLKGARLDIPPPKEGLGTPPKKGTTNKNTINKIRENKKTPRAVDGPVVSKEEKGQQRFFPGKEVTNIFQELGMSTK